MAAALLLPFLGHFALVLTLYVWLTLARRAAVARREAAVGDFARANSDPAGSSRIARNLANQYEAPLFAYFAATILIWAGAVTRLDVVAGWVFLAGRIVHTLVQTRGDDVARRGQVFIINFAAICWLMGHVAWLAITGALP